MQSSPGKVDHQLFRNRAASTGDEPKDRVTDYDFGFGSSTADKHMPFLNKKGSVQSNDRSMQRTGASTSLGVNNNGSGLGLK